MSLEINSISLFSDYILFSGFHSIVFIKSFLYLAMLLSPSTWILFRSFMKFALISCLTAGCSLIFERAWKRNKVHKFYLSEILWIERNIIQSCRLRTEIIALVSYSINQK